jgi:hypothetical protein
MFNQAQDFNDAVRESPGLCPEHRLTMNERRPWGLHQVLVCALCDQVHAEAVARTPPLIPDLPPAHLLSPDEAMRFLVEAFKAMRP